jgi:NAD+ diphosphatase
VASGRLPRSVPLATIPAMIHLPAAFTPLAAARESAAALTFVFRGDELLTREDGFDLPDAAACAAHGADAAVPVGLWEGRYCQAAWRPEGTPAAAGCRWRALRSLFGHAPDAFVAVAGRARQLAEWDRTHRHCGACGGPTERLADEPARRCPACGHGAHPRISPAMMVLVRRGDAILLARHARGTGRWSALAGFLEAGESIEDAVHREVREEVGLEVRDLRYFASQSWPFPHSLMIAFTAEHAGGELRPDGREIAEARWLGPADALPGELAMPTSVARALIDANRRARGAS